MDYSLLRFGVAAIALFLAILYITILTSEALCRYHRLLGCGRLARMRRLMWYTSHGTQEYGWYVELDGKRVAKLTPRYDGHEDFCYSYVLRSMAFDVNVTKDLLDGDFWDMNSSRITFRSRLTNHRISYYIQLRGEFHKGPPNMAVINFRNLGLAKSDYTVWDYLVAWKWQKRIVTSRRRRGYSTFDTPWGWSAGQVVLLWDIKNERERAKTGRGRN